MAADEDTQDAVRRVLKERPPEDLPSGAEARLRRRLDKEQRDEPQRNTKASARPRTTVRKKKAKRAR